MAAETRQVRTTSNKVVALVCDRCGRRAVADDPELGEFHAFLRIQHSAGFGSTWADGTEVEVDLCGACAFELLDPIARRSLAPWARPVRGAAKFTSDLETRLAHNAQRKALVERLSAAVERSGKSVDEVIEWLDGLVRKE